MDRIREMVLSKCHKGMKKAERFLITRNNTVGVLGVKHRPERCEFLIVLFFHI